MCWVYAVHLQCVCVLCRSGDHDWLEITEDEPDARRREVKITDYAHLGSLDYKYFELQERRLLFQVVAVRGDSEASQASDMPEVLGMRVRGEGEGLDWVVWSIAKAKQQVEYKAVHHPLLQEVKDIAVFKGECALSEAAAVPAPARAPAPAAAAAAAAAGGGGSSSN